MILSPKESKYINDISQILYEFLPGKPHPYANPIISFKGIANEMGLSKYWLDGSKLPSINMLLIKTLENERGKFCSLILNIVNKSIVYRGKKRPIAKNEILNLNDLIAGVGFKIPELWDSEFLNSLAVDDNEKQENNVAKPILIDYDNFLEKFMELNALIPQKRGFAFEKFLNKLFLEFNLDPRSPFRLVGEQIDGSIVFDGNTYLIEAKWQEKPIGNAELLTFQGKITGKSSWTRGIFISISGFSNEGLAAFGRGRSTTLIAITGQDLYAMLSKRLSLVDCISTKVRWAAETGEILKNVFEM